MNTKLVELYESKWSNLIEAYEKYYKTSSSIHIPTHPLLLKIGDEERYKNADIKILFYGQETNDWYEYLEKTATVDKIQGMYEEFFLSNACFSHGGQFWNGINRFLSEISSRFPDKEIDYLWNNVVKVGKHNSKGFPPSELYQIEKDYFNILQDELDILKPNLVILFSGPNYDSILKEQFPSIKFSKLGNFTERQLSIVNLPGVTFSFRTYHPNYLWRNDIMGYFNEILNTIQF